MRLQKALKFHLHDSKKAIAIFYAVIIGITIFFHSMMTILVNGEEAGTFNVDSSSIIFLVILSVISITATFQFFLQNGISRKMYFLSNAISKVIIVAFMAVVDVVISAVSNLVFTSGMVNMGILDMLYMNWYGGEKTALFYIDQILQRFAVYLLFAILASCIGAMFYRMGKMLKILVGAGVPILLAIVLPVVDMNLTNGRIFGAIADFFMFVSGFKNGGNPYYLIGFSLLGAVLFCIPTWLLVRRATAKS